MHCLAAFRDDQIDVDDGRKLVLAINLGLLSSFIESEPGKDFTLLRKYIYRYGILSNQLLEDTPSESSVFYHVSFSDYQLFTLSEEGAQSTCLEDLFSRIFTEDPSGRNRFYNAYAECVHCPIHMRCPVRHNYAFLGSSQIQKAVIFKLITAIIKNKTIITMREVLDFIYHIIVHHSFDRELIQRSSSQWITFLNTYLPCTTPMLLFEYEDVSPLIDVVRQQDVLKDRSDENDTATLSFYALEDVSKHIAQVVAGTSYEFMISEEYRWSDMEPDRKELRKTAYQFAARLKDIKQPRTICSDLYLQKYLQHLYMSNTGQGKPKELIELVRYGVFAWHGDFGNRRICIDDTNDKFYILEELELRAEPVTVEKIQEAVIDQFSLIVRVRMSHKTHANKWIQIDIDYSLYELLQHMKNGYRPTIQDKNIHTDFVSAINTLVEYGHKNERIMLYPKGAVSSYEIEIEASDFDFDFKVVYG